MLFFTRKAILLLCSIWMALYLSCMELVLGFQPFVQTKRNENVSSFGRKSQLCSSSNDDDDDDSKDGSVVGTWNPLRLAVLKLGFTELRFTSPLNYEKRDGLYRCANCQTVLFESSGKYDSQSGWPSFWKSAEANRVSLKREWDGRLECTCQNCNGHLGHVFPDGPLSTSMTQDQLQSIPPTDPSTSTRLPRFCINGASLLFTPTKDQ